MSGNNRHIIKKQFVELNLINAGDAFNLQIELEDVCKNEIIPEIEKLFDGIAPVDKFLRIEKLEIDAGMISAENWKNEFLENVIEKISAAIETFPAEAYIRNDRNGNFINEEENVRNLFLFFLENGYMPWYSGIKKRTELNSLINELLANSDEKFLQRLKDLLKNNKKSLNRFIFQIDESELNRYSEKLFSETYQKGILRKLSNALNSLNLNYEHRKELIYGNFFEVLLNKKDKEKEILKEISIGILSSPVMKKNPELKINFVKCLAEDLKDIKDSEVILKSVRDEIPVNENNLTESEEVSSESEFYLSNSGLVIIHPFLLKLFENAGYIENNIWISKERQQRAIALTQYAVTGEEEYPEFLLILNKVLCGFEISESLPGVIKLSELEKNEADELLGSVIGHWTALKKTTVKGLREAFLIRNGKLSRDSGGWLLQTEVKTVDILLNKLPWGMSMIKLPWMKEMLRVEWNY